MGDNIKTYLKECGLDSTGSGYGPVIGTCAYGNNTLAVTKDEEFHDNLSNYQFFKKDIRLVPVTETRYTLTCAYTHHQGSTFKDSQ